MWSPQDGPQVDAIDGRYAVDELFYGGARGGGKSDFLLGDYLIDVEAYGSDWKGILIRRTYPELEELITRGQEIFECGDLRQGAPCEWKVSAQTFQFSNGATLKLRHMDKDNDWTKYQGHQYTWIGWDELPLFSTSGPYKRMKATLRSTKVPEKAMRIRSTGNPGGPGMSWVKLFFQITGGSKNGYTALESESIAPGGKPSIRMYIPSKVQDNKILLENQPSYIQQLWDSCEGNEELFKAWLDGDWDVFFGAFFSAFEPSVHKIEEPFPIPRTWRLYGSLDYGEASPTAFGLWAVDENDTSYRVAEYYEAGLWVGEHAGRIRDLCENNVWTRGRIPERIWADSAIFHTRSATGHGPANRMVSDIFKDHGLRVVPSNKDRISGWRWLKNCLAWKKDDNGEYVQKPKIYYYPDCIDFERTMQNAVFAGTEENPKEDIDTTTEDHIPDEVRYYAMGHYKARNRQKENKAQVATFGEMMKIQKQRRKGRLNRKQSFYIQNEPRNQGIPELMFDD